MLIYDIGTIIGQDKIVPGALVFIKVYFHEFSLTDNPCCVKFNNF